MHQACHFSVALLNVMQHSHISKAISGFINMHHARKTQCRNLLLLLLLTGASCPLPTKVALSLDANCLKPRRRI